MRSLVLTQDALEEVVDAYSKADAFAFDVETIGDDRLITHVNRVAWIQLATTGRCDVIPIGHPHGEFVGWDRALTGAGEKRLAKGLEIREQDYSKAKTKWKPIWTDAPEQLTPAQVFSALKPIFMSPDILKVGQNLIFDLESVAKYLGGPPVGPYFDCMVAGFLLDSRNAEKGNLGLDDALKRELGYEMVKGVGKDISIHSFSEVFKYSYLDAKYTWLLYRSLKPKLEKSGLHKVMYEIEMPVMEVVTDMELTGAHIDEGALRVLADRLGQDLTEAMGDCYRAAGVVFNINSTAEKQKLLYSPKDRGGQGLKPTILTGKGKQKKRDGEELELSDFSTDADALAEYPSNKLAQAIRKYQTLSKLNSGYVIPYLGGEVTKTVGGKSKVEVKESLLINGKIHARFKQTGAETGRFSCVSGDTLLNTSRGTFRFDEYLPAEGDLVLTHTLSWKPVLRKIYKGEQEMFKVSLDNGSVLNCTMDHKVLTYTGWSKVGDLVVGDEVASYVSVQEVCGRSEECGAGASNVPIRLQTDHSVNSSFGGDYLSQCSSHSSRTSSEREVESRESSSIFSIEGGGEEPYAGQEWFPTPWVQGRFLDQGWVPSDQGRWQVHIGASPCNGFSLGPEETSVLAGRSPYRLQQTEQRPWESGCGNEGSSWEASPKVSRINEITSLGSMGVWDIEVEGDHSYLAGGFVNHNSANPNLQNVPNASTEYGKMIRNLFVAPEGFKLVSADYSQIEPRIIASFSKDPIMMGSYLNGEDIYTTIGNTVGVDRAAGKVLVLSMAYGVGPDKIATEIGCNVKTAQKLLDDFSSKMRGVESYKQAVIKEARRKNPPHVKTLMGRVRYLPELKSMSKGLVQRAERQAFNTVIQGSAADIMKLALVRAHKAITPLNGKLILTVHDEVVCYVPEENVEESVAVLKEAMEGFNMLSVPLIAEAKVATSWGDAK